MAIAEFTRAKHIEYWDKLQRVGAVPESEYDEHPRGRVMFNFKTAKFILYADECILSRKGLVRRILSWMNLPLKNTETGTDWHYRCPKCLD
jgi:hypothetical protein